MTESKHEAPRLLTLADGRRLAWTEIGAPQGRPVVILHGSPGCRWARYGDAAKLAEANIRLITYDRPGYGDSDALPGRSIRDAVGDIEAILDAAEVKRTAFVGNSGGGAHALAVACLLAPRATLAWCNVGVAPKTLFDGDFFEGMDAQNVLRFESAMLPREQAHAALKPDLDRVAAAARSDPMNIHTDMKLPEADRKLMRESSAQYAETLLEAVRPGYWGFIDDFAAHTRDWGFDPRQPKIPVVIEYGAHDVNVPAGHGRWLAQYVPSVEIIVNQDAGHRSPAEKVFQRLLRLAAA